LNLNVKIDLEGALMKHDQRPSRVEGLPDAMNRKAMELGMLSTHFEDPTGLTDENVSSPEDLAQMVLAADGYPMIRDATTSSSRIVRPSGRRPIEFHNTNRLVGSGSWDIELSKTGYINEAGRCLVMKATIAARQVVIVLLDSWGKYTRLGDAGRIRRWMEGVARAAGARSPI